MSAGIDFGKVDTAKPNQFIQPGEYMMKIIEVKLGSAKNGNPYIAVTAERKETKQKITDKFYLSEASLPRLKYLFVAYMGKEQFDEVLTSHQEVADYLHKNFTAKEVYKPFVVGGDIADDEQVYSKFPWAGFILDPKDFKGDREYAVGSPEYKQTVKKQKMDKQVKDTNKTAINAGNRPAGSKQIWDVE